MNLRPELRPDKNGKLVTKHVRSEVKGSTGKSAIPAPHIAKKITITKARRPVYVQIMEQTGVVNGMSARDWETVKKSLAHLDDESLNKVASVVNQASVDFRSVNVEFMKVAIRANKALGATETVESLIQEAPSAGLTDPTRTFGGALLGAAQLEMLDDEWGIPEDQGDRVRANVLVTQSILEFVDKSRAWGSVSMSPVGAFYIKDLELKDFVEQNADRRNEIVDAIRSRGVADVGMLRELLSHEVTSLNTGVL